jgi:large subunit ribosomal protein L25
MNESAKLTITKRAKGSKGAMNRLRKEGFLPGSLSRKGDEAVSFSVRKDEFGKALRAHGMSGIYTLQLDKKTAYSAMVREIQYVPGSADYLHVTFQLVSLTEETTADIHVHVKGRDELHHNGYEFLQQLDSLHLKGLPGAFPSVLNVDISKMVPGDQVTVAEVELPEGLTCLTEPDRMIVSVHHPKVHEEKAEEEPAEAGETPVQAPAEAGEGGGAQ